MRKFIITTTINEPTEALTRFSKMPDWTLIVVGDKKTPHQSYKKLNCIYLHPDEQEKKYPKLSELIGWNCIQRRNIGFVEAYRLKADIFATVDDDNIPFPEWGQNLTLEYTTAAEYYRTDVPVFDPLVVTEYPNLWHRGFPIQLLDRRYEIKAPVIRRKKFLVQADLWNGDPDVDAICRIMYKPKTTFRHKFSFYSNKPSPFNSQNTFLSRKVMKDYFLFPGIGRMDDIWASYYLQAKHSESVVYCPASVIQKRNPHSVEKDMQDEVLGYQHSLRFAVTPVIKLLPVRARAAFREYQKLLNERIY